ncbi:MAG TPA: efflux RND transporter permease subunit, partial [Candidatus Obscuribacterales bacterium]
ATISFNLHPGYSLGTAVAAINSAAPGAVTPDVTMSFQGQAQAFQQSFQNLGWLLLLATLIIYTILGMLYESFVHPVTILSGLPAAGLGALVTLMLFGVDLDIYGILGLIMLIGIVKKNAIMMIDFAIEVRRDEHVTAHDAIYQACLVRFRPIMMTTMAALMGSIPIALGLGAGGESRQPLGLAVLGGLVVSQLLTLYITPVVYMYLDDFQERMKRRTVDRGPATGSQPASA